MDRKLIDYLPRFVQEHKEIKAIMDAEQVDVESTWNVIDDVLNNQFVVDATEDGVGRWESILSIQAKTTDTLDERKFRILTRLNEQLPYTEEKLRSMLTSLLGADGFLLRVTPSEYTVTVKLAIDNEVNYQSVVDLLYKVLPANLERIFAIFNTNITLSTYTYGELAAYTHDQLRKDMLS